MADELKNVEGRKSKSEDRASRRSSLPTSASNTSLKNSSSRENSVSISRPRRGLSGIANLLRRDSSPDASSPLVVSNTKKAMMTEGLLRIQFGLDIHQPVMRSTWEQLLTQNKLSSKRVSLYMAALTGDIASLTQVNVDEAKGDEDTWSDAVMPLEFEIDGGAADSPVQSINVGPVALAAERLDVDTLDFIRQRISAQEWGVAIQDEIVRGTGKTPIGFLEKELATNYARLDDKSMEELVRGLRICKAILDVEEANGVPNPLEAKADDGPAVKKIRDKILVAVIPHITDLEDKSVEELVELLRICGGVLEAGNGSEYIPAISAKVGQIIRQAIKIIKGKVWNEADGTLSMENLDSGLAQLDLLLAAIPKDGKVKEFCGVVRLAKEEILSFLAQSKREHARNLGKARQIDAIQCYQEAAEIFKSLQGKAYKKEAADVYMSIYQLDPTQVDIENLVFCAQTYHRVALLDQALEVCEKALACCPQDDKNKRHPILTCKASVLDALARKALALSEAKGDGGADEISADARAALKGGARRALKAAEAAYQEVANNKGKDFSALSARFVNGLADLECTFSNFSQALKLYEKSKAFELNDPGRSEENMKITSLRIGLYRVLHEVHKIEVTYNKELKGIITSIANKAGDNSNVYEKENFGAYHIHGCALYAFAQNVDDPSSEEAKKLYGGATISYEKALTLWNEQISTKEEKGNLLLALARCYGRLPNEEDNVRRVYALVEAEGMQLEKIDLDNKEEARKSGLRKDVEDFAKAAKKAANWLGSLGKGASKPEDGADEEKDGPPPSQQAQVDEVNKAGKKSTGLFGRIFGAGKKSGSAPDAGHAAEALDVGPLSDGSAAAAAGIFAVASSASVDGAAVSAKPPKVPQPPAQPRPSMDGEQDNKAGAVKPKKPNQSGWFSKGGSANKGGPSAKPA